MKKLHPGTLAFLILGLAMAAGLTWMTEWSLPRVAENQEAKAHALLKQMLPSDRTDITTQSFQLLAPNYLKMGDIQTATRVFKGKQPTQVIYRALSHKAYHDKIGVMASFDGTCTVTHVEIISHRETPGLGDQYKKNDFAWLKSLAGKTPSTDWALKPKGDIDTWTGATVTPTAITETLARMQLLCVHEHDLLFSHEGLLYLEIGDPKEDMARRAMAE